MITAQYMDHMGTDLTPVNAARVSFDKQSFLDANGQLLDKDVRLIDYLAEHEHFIPFAHAQFQVRCRAPIAIARQAFKHKVGFVENEVSRRYVSSRPEYFEPIAFRKAAKDKKQGSSSEQFEGIQGYTMMRRYEAHMEYAIKYYEELIAEGVCPEQARFVLPQGVMTEWVWTGSLLAYARFYNLRTKPDAQLEIQGLARQVGNLVKDKFPVSWTALTIV